MASACNAPAIIFQSSRLDRNYQNIVITSDIPPPPNPMECPVNLCAMCINTLYSHSSNIKVTILIVVT